MSDLLNVTHVLICEDSRTYAAVLKRALEYDGDIEVTAVTSSAEAALATLDTTRPDVVTMDIELPGMSGLGAVEQIMGSRPCPIMIISSHIGPSSGQAAAALAAGALDAASKDNLDLMDPTSQSAVALRARIRQLSNVTVINHPRSRLRPRVSPDAEPRSASIIGICASTGGPQALRSILSLLPMTFPIPVVVVQHIASGFGKGLRDWLDDEVPLPVRLAGEGDTAGPGVWIAPDEADLRVGPRGAFTFDRSQPAGLHRPSGDALFASLARVAGSLAVAVVLSGMGRDGATGARAVHEAGGLVLAQDEATSAVYGMPKVTAREAAAVVLPLEEIAARLMAIQPRPFRP